MRYLILILVIFVLGCNNTEHSEPYIKLQSCQNNEKLILSEIGKCLDMQAGSSLCVLDVYLKNGGN